MEVFDCTEDLIEVAFDDVQRELVLRRVANQLSKVLDATLRPVRILDTSVLEDEVDAVRKGVLVAVGDVQIHPIHGKDLQMRMEVSMGMWHKNQTIHGKHTFGWFTCRLTLSSRKMRTFSWIHLR